MFDVIETENRLLLIDESREATALLTKLLTANYACDEADSLDSAVAKLRLKDYSVILANLDLPNVSLIQTVAPLSVIILLGETFAADVVIEAFRAGVFDFLQTPLEFAQVETVVGRAVEHYEMKCLKKYYQYHRKFIRSKPSSPKSSIRANSLRWCIKNYENFRFWYLHSVLQFRHRLIANDCQRKTRCICRLFYRFSQSENFAPDTNRHNHFRCLRRGFDGWNLSGWLCVKTVISR